jgi:hypothetical protein
MKKTQELLMELVKQLASNNYSDQAIEDIGRIITDIELTLSNLDMDKHSSVVMELECASNERRLELTLTGIDMLLEEIKQSSCYLGGSTPPSCNKVILNTKANPNSIRITTGSNTDLPAKVKSPPSLPIACTWNNTKLQETTTSTKTK